MKLMERKGANMWKKIAILEAVLLLAGFGTFAYFFVRGVSSESSDHRRLIALAPAERDLVLGEMRSMLKAVNGVIEAVAKGDLAQVATHASSAGMGMAVDVNPALMAKLPLDFKELGMGTHSLFDDLARQSKAGASAPQILDRLASITKRCVACHEANRLAGGLMPSVPDGKSQPLAPLLAKWSKP